VTIREATAEELQSWDSRTVDVPGGHVFQSRTWGEYRARHGWRPKYLVFDDGFCLLAAERPWPLLGGGGAYLARGPVRAGEPAETTADRLRAAADWLAAHGADVVSSDAEVPVETGYPELLEQRGFHQIEEVQPSRHRMSLPFVDGADADAVFEGFSKSLRQTIRTAENKRVRIVRYDAGPIAPDQVADLLHAPPDPDLPAGGPSDPARTTNAELLAPVFDRFHGLLAQAAERRHFPVAPKAQLIDSASHALANGLLIQLEAWSPDDELISGAMFWRHGRRLTYALSADRVSLRQQFPGVVQLGLWRAIQLALLEGRDEFDLAGVDIAGARHRPQEGDEMHGLFAMKERFGAHWVDLAGNHEWVARPWSYAAGRVAARLRRFI
jgi:lipid II:glycine glycyltransferase (peptidoglycan interpeptide bridge formation enzyme)